MDIKIPTNPFTLIGLALRYTIIALVLTARFILNFIATQWHSYNPLGQFVFAVSLFAITVDAAVAYQYGVSMTKLHGWGFAIVAIAFCILPDIAIEAARARKWAAAIGLGIGCFGLGLVALQSHLGYGGGIRLKEMQQNGFHVLKAADVRKSADSEEKNLAAWRKTLETKQGELASLKEAAGWVTSIDAPSLEAELATLRERMAAEEKGQRGKKAGRGKEYENLQNQANAVGKRLDAVKRFNALSDEIKGLEHDIKTTQAIVDKKTTKVAEVGFESNVIVNQNDIAASLVNFLYGVDPEQAIRPTEVQRVVANTLITGFNSLGFLLCAPLLQIAAGLNRRRSLMRRDDEPATDESGAPEAAYTVPQASLSDKYATLFANKYGATA